MLKQEILFVINPKAGRDRNKGRLLAKIDRYLDKSKFHPIIAFTERPHHACELVKDYLKKGVKEFVAVGGDGTINEVAKELLYSNAVLNIIAKGSGNGLARHLEIYDDEDLSIKRINTGEIRTIDAGSINGIPFVCTAGLGFDAFGAKQFSKIKGRGLRNYILAGLKSFFRFKPINLNFKGQNYSVFSISFGNASQYGNNAYITPKAVIDDGFIDCCLLKEHPKKDSVKLLRLLFSKKIHESKHAIYYKEKAYAIETEKPALIHCDGESIQLNTTKVKVHALKKGLRIRL